MARVLIVDADEGIRETLKDLLAMDGYSVLEASTPEQAVAVLRGCPDCLVVVFDSGVPHRSHAGIETIVDMDPEVVGRHTLICLTTNAVHLNARLRHLLAAHDIPVIQKPFDMGALLGAVAQAATVVDARNRGGDGE